MRIHARPGHTSFTHDRYVGAETGHAESSRSPSPKGSSGSPLDAFEALAQWRTMEERAEHQEPRWPAASMPLAVHIEANPAWTADTQLQERQRLLKMMRQWEAASWGELRFREVLSREQADIVIEWTDQTTRGRDYEVGHTNLDVTGAHAIRHAVITLVSTPKIDAHLSPQQRERRELATILHETGHALGLRHSEHKQDVMHHRGWQNMALSMRDAERIRKLYEPAPPLRV